MVKGISRQVIVVQSPDKELFEQAIFILTDGAVEKGVTDEMLLKQANLAIRGAGKRPAVKKTLYVWPGMGGGRCRSDGCGMADHCISVTCQKKMTVL